MTKKEKQISNCLVKAFNLFIKLDKQHPDEQRDFTDGIHKCQYILGMRIARKYDPENFPIKKR